MFKYMVIMQYILKFEEFIKKKKTYKKVHVCLTRVNDDLCET